MDKASRNKAIIKERQKNHTTFSALGEKFGITAGRAHQIVSQSKESGLSFYSRLSYKPNKNRIRRTILTKTQVAERLGIPEDKLELHI